MRYGEIRRHDVANGVGIRTVIFVTGCTFNCPECFNKEYQSFDNGEEWTHKQTEEVIKYLEEIETDGITILGGEPMLNATDLIPIVKEIKKHSKKSIWIYSGFTYEQILIDEERKELLKLCDVLIDGLFIEQLKDLKLKFRGSSNQRIIDIQSSLLKNEVVLEEKYNG